MDSLLTLPEAIHLPGMPEHFTALLTSDSGLLVERIVSWGHVTPEGQWYDQKKDEWVLLLEGAARHLDGVHGVHAHADDGGDYRRTLVAAPFVRTEDPTFKVYRVNSIFGIECLVVNIVVAECQWLAVLHGRIYIDAGEGSCAIVSRLRPGRYG